MARPSGHGRRGARRRAVSLDSRAVEGRVRRRRDARSLTAAGLAALALVAAGCGAAGYAPASADKQNGKKLFQQKCGGCHTLADAGTTGTVGPNLDAAFEQARAAGMTEDTVRQVVRGQIAFPVTTPSTGAPGMPKDLVKGRDAEDVAAYVASVAGKQAPGAAPPPPAQTTPAETAPTGTTPAPAGGAHVAAGKKVFLSAGCGACHTLADAGSGGTVGPNLDQLKPSRDRVAAQVTNGGGAMPAFKDRLSKQQIEDVAAYVSSVAGR